jgi:hypothetical protein
VLCACGSQAPSQAVPAAPTFALPVIGSE